MTLRARVILAQLPALIALILMLIVGGTTLQRVGRQGQDLLAQNYRSVLAAQRMKESIERIDSAALFRIAGEVGEADKLLAQHQPAFEAELRAEEANITERGETEAARALRGAWTDYQARYDTFREAAPDARRDLYFSSLYPTFLQVKAAADQILTINQDAMVRKSEAAASRSSAARRDWVLWSALGVVGAALLGATLSHRIAAPLLALTRGAARVGEGHLEIDLPPSRIAELDELARAFNQMTARLRHYRRLSEGELARAREAAQAAIESLTDPVLVLSVQGDLRASNAAARRLGADLDSLDPELRSAIDGLRRAVNEEGRAVIPADFSGVVHTGPQGVERALLPHAMPIHDAVSGELVGVTVLLQDVTRFRRLDELKGDLVQTVAHELRTPLTSLGMALHLVLDERVSGGLNDQVHGLLGAAREDVGRLRALVEDLLDLSRVQEGRVVLHAEPVALSGLLDEVVAAASGPAQAAGVTLTVEPPPDRAVDLDRARMRLALGNLVINAVRHAPRGSAVLVRAVPTEAGVRLEVDDAGPGVPADQRGRIFEPFVRGESEDSEGAGLGLSIAREIVRAHGGSVGVSDAPSGGARFWIELLDREA